eukprot:COSAG06_NODE_13243_length_1278_cov_56.287532_2_plen_164_part_00
MLAIRMGPLIYSESPLELNILPIRTRTIWALLNFVCSCTAATTPPRARARPRARAASQLSPSAPLSFTLGVLYYLCVCVAPAGRVALCTGDVAVPTRKYVRPSWALQEVRFDSRGVRGRACWPAYAYGARARPGSHAGYGSCAARRFSVGREYPLSLGTPAGT